MTLTPTQIALLAGILVVGLLTIAIVAILRRRRGRQSPFEELYYRGQNWILPAGTTARVLDHLSAADRAYVVRIATAIRTGRPSTPAELAQYDARLALAIRAEERENPGILTLFTPAGQALLRRRRRGER